MSKLPEPLAIKVLSCVPAKVLLSQCCQVQLSMLKGMLLLLFFNRLLVLYCVPVGVSWLE